MATRSIIQVPNAAACIYKHWDGHPDDMLPWLTDFNKEFTAKRGNDPAYKLAQCLRFSVRNGEKYGLDMSTETGWGIVALGADWGEDYVYVLENDGTVTVKIP